MKKSEQQLDNILSFLDSYISSNGFSPSYREISEGVKLKSTNSVKEYLDILEQRNLIKRQPTKNRTIEIVGKNKTEVVTAFSGLLEMSRRDKVVTKQEELFGDIEVEKSLRK